MNVDGGLQVAQVGDEGLGVPDAAHREDPTSLQPPGRVDRSVHLHPAGIRPVQRADDIQQGAFAGAAGAHNGHIFAGLHLQRYAVQGMNLDGAGKLSRTVRYDQGTLLSPTSLAVVADELQLKLRSYTAGGSGNVTIVVNDGAPEKLDLGIRFATIDVVHQEDNTSHFIGEDLLLTTAGSSRLLPWQERRSGARSASVTIPRVMIPDLKVYQRYVPDKAALTLNGGRGELAGQTTLTSTSLQAGLNLRSSGADIGFRNHQLMTNLDLDVNIDVPSFGSGKLDISGTKIQLSDVRLASQEPGKPTPWNASLSIDQGLLVLPHPRSGGDAGHIRQLSYLKQESLKSLLGKADAHKIPEALFDLFAQRHAQLIVHDIIDIAEVKKYGQVVDDAVDRVLRHILSLNGGH